MEKEWTAVEKQIEHATKSLSRSRTEALLIEELAEDNLAQLQASIEQLKQSPEGTAELQRRVKSFGECQ